jgi:hypothetical protein
MLLIKLQLVMKQLNFLLTSPLSVSKEKDAHARWRHSEIDQDKANYVYFPSSIQSDPINSSHTGDG